MCVRGVDRGNEVMLSAGVCEGVDKGNEVMLSAGVCEGGR